MKIGGGSKAAICFALGCVVVYPAHLSADTIQDENFINAVYLDLLDRPADPSGLDLNVNFLNSGGTYFQVANSVDTSPEYYTDLVDSYYQSYLGRPADPESALLVSLLSKEGGTDQEVQETILGSTEYFGNQGDSNANFVISIYRLLLNRTPSTEEADSWISLLNIGTLTRSQVVAAFLGSPEYESDEIGTWFQSFLGRAAEAEDLGNFLTELQDAVTDETAIAQIIGSQEFFNLAQESPTQGAPEPDTFLPLALGLGFLMMRARRAVR
jgi:hypothetical protein